MTESLKAHVTQTEKRVREVEPLRIGILGRAELIASRINAACHAGRWFAPAASDNGMCIHVHVDQTAGYQMRDTEDSFACPHVHAGHIVAYDLGTAPSVRFDGGASPIALTVPHAAIAAVADELNAAPTGHLDLALGRPFEDERLRSLANLLLYEDVYGPRCSSFFRDQVALALVVHLATAHGAIVELSNLPRGGLAPWQVRRATEMMTSGLDGEIGLKEVALQCGLSLSHFSRAFRRSLGSPPHTWLTHRRIDAAKSMMRGSRRPLSEIALACGFADQSHFTRVFSREIGTSPGAWRRCLVP